MFRVLEQVYHKKKMDLDFKLALPSAVKAKLAFGVCNNSRRNETVQGVACTLEQVGKIWKNIKGIACLRTDQDSNRRVCPAQPV
jgi:hypothetical protein